MGGRVHRGERVGRAALAGLAVGALLTAGIARSRHGSTTGDRTIVDEFVGAWRHSLTGTYAATDHLERRLLDGGRLADETTIIQRPPDRLRRAGGRVEGRIRGVRVRCGAPPGAVVSCRVEGAAQPFGAEVADELARLRATVRGPRALYGLRRTAPGCFAIRLRLRVLAPPYGEDATFCFDARTGAVVGSTIHRAQATDVHRTVDLREEVTDRQLVLPAPLRR